MVRNYDISQFMMLYVPRSMTYKYHLRSGSELKAKNLIYYQNWSFFYSIINLNRRIITPLLGTLVQGVLYTCVWSTCIQCLSHLSEKHPGKIQN